MALLPKPRLLKLQELTCSLFNTVYNPTSARTGNKILKQRLIGPSIVNWYPAKMIKLKEISNMFPDFDLVDQGEQRRLDDIARRKRRGKGAPKKGQGKRAIVAASKKK
ncbi:10320_t:CDS:2 [Paraglomus occultum]|uniref:Small ribosomal subunit protein mS33 n=1 Tax=Paraglomus occultum TaxID=144539 RepID=A0A9N8Z0B8_9GLOM|nr:10320_t:CDS:2 [Paraglomus occultum]